MLAAGSTLGNKMRFYWERGVIFLHNGLSRKNLFDVSIANTGIAITRLPAFAEAEVIHLHWVNQGLLSVEEIGRIVASGKKVVWTMHDMWPFTGICHHAGTCNAYGEGCGGCPYLRFPQGGDLSHRIFGKKEKAYGHGEITFTACSRWLEGLGRQSPLTRGHRVVSIPNPIDTSVFLPKDKTTVRQKMGLPHDKKIVLFAAMKASDKRKGIDYLMEAARLVARKRTDLLFLIAGDQGEEITREFPLPTRSTGFIPSGSMPDLYNAADLFVTPSLQENLPNTIMEAMACGTPCLGFDIGGIPEMIDHRENGYVARYKDAQDLAEGMLWTLFHADAQTLARNARRKVTEQYAQHTVALQYKEIYGLK